MNSCKQLWFSTSVLAVISMFGCGGPESYSESNLSMIQFDCQQTAPCDPVFSLREDSVAECIKDTSTKLDIGSDQFRMLYEQRFTRCAGRVDCQYYDCAQDSMLFSIVHEQQLRNECQQAVVCKIQQSQPTAPNDADLCFMSLSAQLDFATVPDKATWEQRVGRCTGQAGCAYVNCR
jgi:hypothetical protein